MKRHRHSTSQTGIACLVGFWLLLLPWASLGQPLIYITGKVIDGPGGKVVNGASVSLRQGVGTQPLTVAQSLGNGSFVLKVPAAGSYQVVAIGPGWRSAVRLVDVPAKGLDGLTLELGPTVIPNGDVAAVTKAQLAPIHVRVVDSAGAPVRRGALQAWVVWSPIPPAMAATPGQGYTSIQVRRHAAFELPRRDDTAWGIWSGSVPAAVGSVEVEGPPEPVPVVPCRVGIGVRSELFGCGRLVLDAWPDRPVTVKLARCGGVHVRVTTKAHVPTAGVRVSVVGMDLDPCLRFLQGWASDVTGKTGEVDLPNVAAGRYFVCLPSQYNSGVGNTIHILQKRAAEDDLAMTFPDEMEFPPQWAGGIHWLGDRMAREDYGIIDETGRSSVREREPYEIRAETLLPSRMGPQHRQHPIHVSGKLVWNPGGPLPRVRMEILRSGWVYPIDAVLTRQDGSFDLAVLAPGDYTLRVDQDPFVPQILSLAVPAVGGTGLRVIVIPRPWVKLKLVGPDGAPLTSGGVREQVSSAHAAWETSMQVEAGGVLALPWSYHEAPDAADPIWISLRHETVGWAEVLLPHWPDAPVTLKLQPGATLSCRVLDDAGKPQEGATVSLRRWAQKADVGLPRLLHDDYCQTDAAGRAVFIQVPPGVYNLTAQVGPWQPLVKDVTVGKANLDVTLQPPVTPVDGITGVHVQLAPQQRTGGLQQERP